MSMYRTVSQLNRAVRQCSRLSVVTNVHQRKYSDMAFTFATPLKVHYENVTVKQVDVPSFSGSFGVLADHVPMVAVLKPGIITVHENDSVSKQYFVSSGSIAVNKDSTVQILAEEAVAIDDLDKQCVKEGLVKANSELSSATTDSAKAEAQISVDCFEALEKVVQ